MPDDEQEQQPNELLTKLPEELHSLLERRDGSAMLLAKLPQIFLPLDIAHEGDAQRAWELTGLHYFGQRRFHEALAIFSALYDHMVTAQVEYDQRYHKGTPLLWMSECYSLLGFPVHAKRYLMLTLVEDAISTGGEISPDATGTYFRLVWGRGLSDTEFHRYARRIADLAKDDPGTNRFPEWVLQELDQNWMVELPSVAETSVFRVNRQYVEQLVQGLGEPTGQVLERLAQYVLSCMAGCRTYRRKRSGSTDYDIICSMDGFDVDFRSEFGRYFVCECKDWASPADFTTMAKFCRVLDSTKCRFGIIFSKRGISGQDKSTNAEREQLKVFQDRGMVIIVVTESDLKDVATNANFVQILRAKYEKVRLDLVDDIFLQ